mgnify:CR=1 FL=1
MNVWTITTLKTWINHQIQTIWRCQVANIWQYNDTMWSILGYKYCTQWLEWGSQHSDNDSVQWRWQRRCYQLCFDRIMWRAMIRCACESPFCDTLPSLSRDRDGVYVGTTWYCTVPIRKFQDLSANLYFNFVCNETTTDNYGNFMGQVVKHAMCIVTFILFTEIKLWQKAWLDTSLENLK